MVSTNNQNPMESLSVDDLTPVVRRITGDDAASVMPGWTAKRIGKSVGFGTVGLYRVTGEAESPGTRRQWSAVLKVLDERAGGTGAGFVSPKTEIAAYRSGIFEKPAGAEGFRAATCYAIHAKADGSHWLWLEDISDAPVPPWSDDQYISSARHIGQFSGIWTRRPLPIEPWLGRDKFEASILGETESVLALRQNSIVARAIPADLVERAAIVRPDLQFLASTLRRLPSTVCHSDCHPKNLLLVMKGSSHAATVAIDWASASLGPVGIDSGGLIGSGLVWTEMGAERARRLEKPVFDSYMAGLTDAGWRGDPRHARLGFLAFMTRYCASMISITTSMATDIKRQERISGLVGKPVATTLDEYQRNLRFLLPLLDEAVELAKQV